MKKSICIICFILLLSIIPIYTYATDYIDYYIDELGLNINMPSDMIVVTRKYTSDESLFTDLEQDLELFQQSFVDSNIYLTALARDLSSEITITMVSDEGAQSIWNSKDHKNELSYAADDIAKELEETGVVAIAKEVYETETALYLVMDLKSKTDIESYGRIYTTFMNGQGINITSWSHTGPLSIEQMEQQKYVVNSMVFDEILENPNPQESIKDIILSILGSGVFGGVVAFIFFTISQKFRIKKYLKVCSIDPSTFTGDTFTYKEKLYDKEKFISDTISRLDSVKNDEKIMKKISNQTLKKAHSRKPDAILYQLELEAISNLLSNINK